MQVQAVNMDMQEPEGMAFKSVSISTVGSTQSSKWTERLTIEGVGVPFRLDTGAMVSVLPLKVYQELKSALKLEHTQVRLHAFNGSVVKPCGVALLHTSKPGFGVSVKYSLMSLIRTPLIRARRISDSGSTKYV